MMKSRQCVAVLNGIDFFGDVDDFRTAKDLAQAAVRDQKLTTPRADPREVKVEIFNLAINKGKLERYAIGAYAITPTLERMTSAEFAAEEKELLARLPEELRGWASGLAYDRGHSSGHEEVINVLEHLTSALEVPLEKYTHRITKEAVFNR